MLQLASMTSEPHRMDRYQPTYQQVGQPVYQYNQRHMSSAYPLSTDKTENYVYHTSHATGIAPVAPPTPPAEDMLKPQTLPSISSLLEISEARRASSISFAQQQSAQQHRQNVQHFQQQVEQPQPQQQQQQQQSFDSNMSEQAPISFMPTPAQTVRQSFSMPATPPLVHDTIQSPSAMSTHSVVSVPQTYYLPTEMGHVEQQSRSFSEPNLMKPHALAVHHHYSSPYATSPQSMSLASYYSGSPVSQTSGMYAQRPLPSNFPPAFTSPFGTTSSGGLNISTANPWQHHHYIGASSQSTFPQSQDRYVCPTCSKAFSRPSSLRIHSHSHTGEKPFKCSFQGCGKAFSVRSNMKRHERGCHGDLSCTK